MCVHMCVSVSEWVGGCVCAHTLLDTCANALQQIYSI